jgi:hypothetical protein
MLTGLPVGGMPMNSPVRAARREADDLATAFGLLEPQ